MEEITPELLEKYPALKEALNLPLLDPFSLKSNISRTSGRSKPSTIVNKIPSNPHNSHADSSFGSSELSAEVSEELTESLKKISVNSSQNDDYVIKNGWIDCGDYWISTNNQGTEEWLKDRYGRVTGSTSKAAAYGAQYGPKIITPTETARKMAGLYKEVFDAVSLARMQHGTDTEPEARELYSKRTGYEVIERGLYVPIWNPYLGISSDGDVKDTSGALEVKCPRYIYDSLLDHCGKRKRGQKFPAFYHRHIYDSHYCQMQKQAAVMGKEWVDYEVYSKETHQIYLERIPFNPDFWYGDFYPAILNFIEKELFPILPRPVVIPWNC